MAERRHISRDEQVLQLIERGLREGCLRNRSRTKAAGLAGHIRKMRGGSGKKAASYRGHVFWCGSVRFSDGKIEEVHSYQEAEAADFHTMFYFSPEQVSRMENGESGFFWVEEDGKVRTDWERPASRDIKQKIRKQIKVTRAGKIKKPAMGTDGRAKRE